MACFKCTKDIGTDPSLTCDSCERHLHSECSDLSTMEISIMTSRKRNLRYFCEDCTAGIKLLPKLIKKVDELQEEIDKLKLTDHPPPPENAMPQEKLLTEIHEMHKRANNFMIFNMPKSIVGDRTMAQRLVKDLVKEDLVVDKVLRLGKLNKNGVQALKVVMANTVDANRIITSKKEVLKKRGVFVCPDLTQYQVRKQRELKAQLDERRAKGERDIAIRYVNGIQQIVKVTPRESS